MKYSFILIAILISTLSKAQVAVRVDQWTSLELPNGAVKYKDDIDTAKLDYLGKILYKLDNSNAYLYKNVIVRFHKGTNKGTAEEMDNKKANLSRMSTKNSSFTENYFMRNGRKILQYSYQSNSQRHTKIISFNPKTKIQFGFKVSAKAQDLAVADSLIEQILND